MKNTRRLTLSAILTALSVICVFAAGTLPTGRMALLALSACFTCAVCTMYGTKTALIHYAAVSLLSFFLAPKGAELIAYIMFIGYYPAIRERVRALFLRALIFTAAYALSLLLFKGILLAGLELTLWQYVLLLAGGEALFFIFDYALVCFKTVYTQKIIKKIPGLGKD